MTSKKTPSKKTTKKSSKKAVKKSPQKEMPQVFKPGTHVSQWEQPAQEAERPSIHHLSNLQLKYISTSLMHIQAELELLSEARNTGDQVYADQVAFYISDRIYDLMMSWKETGVIV